MPITADNKIYRVMSPILHNDRVIGSLYLGLSLETMRVGIKKMRITTALVSIIILLLGVAAVFFAGLAITRPLEKMIDTIHQISSGDLSQRVSLYSSFELGNLAHSFNIMIDNLEKYSSELKRLNNNLENEVSERTKKLQVEIEERKLAQDSLQKSEEKYRRMVDNSLVGIYLIQDHIIKSCNRQFAILFGYNGPDEIMGKRTNCLLSWESWEQSEKMFRTVENSLGSTPYRLELKGIKKDGTLFDIEVLENSILYKNKPAAEGIVIDITARKKGEEERQKLEEQLRQAQKMESLGTMAGGIAHDFNNMLSAIMGYTELTLSLLREGSREESNLKKVLSASTRAKELIQQILIFSRKSEKERNPIRLGEVASEALKLMRSTLPTTIEIYQDLNVNLDPVMANKSEIHQIIMNLCTNASHAMREKGGVLCVTLKEIELGLDSLVQKNMEPGLYNQLTVTDTGHGMTPDIIERIFEPYFTTKKEGEGTGMGLSVVHGIVKSCGGEITVYSEPGRGTTFHVFLPVIKTGEYISQKDVWVPIQGGTERILFVDDEPILVDMAREMLGKLGYSAECRTSSVEAFEFFKSNFERIDLVISDQTMPHMTGIQLSRKIREIKPRIPIIISSGFSDAVNEDTYKIQGINGFLMKPIVLKDLARMIRSVLK